MTDRNITFHPIIQVPTPDLLNNKRINQFTTDVVYSTDYASSECYGVLVESLY